MKCVVASEEEKTRCKRVAAIVRRFTSSNLNLSTLSVARWSIRNESWIVLNASFRQSTEVSDSVTDACDDDWPNKLLMRRSNASFRLVSKTCVGLSEVNLALTISGGVANSITTCVARNGLSKLVFTLKINSASLSFFHVFKLVETSIGTTCSFLLNLTS